VNAIFEYVLALAAARYGIEIHAYCVLSNHWHAIVTDPHARLPAFAQLLGALVARAVNATLGRWEDFWGPGGPSMVVLAAAGDVVEKAAYTLANPVAAGLVEHARRWPGLWSAPERIGGPARRVPRPRMFFREDGYTPESVELTLTHPPGFDSAEAFRSAVEVALSALESEARQRLAAEGRRFMGRERVLAQSPFAKPAGNAPRRRLNPRVAARDPGRRVELLAELAQFLRHYRAALCDWAAGMRVDVLFPAGTYQLRIAHGVPCASPS
jgi:REP-associated tyrosine transposase